MPGAALCCIYCDIANATCCAVLQDEEVRRAKLNGEIKKHLTQILLEVTDAVLGGQRAPCPLLLNSHVYGLLGAPMI
jgi:hypothetical protein